MSTIYVLKEGQQTGPFTTGELEGNVEAGVFCREDLFWTEGMDDWQPLANVIEELSSGPDVSPDPNASAGALEEAGASDERGPLEIAEPADVLHEGSNTIVTSRAVHLPCGEEISLSNITKVAVQYEAVRRFRPVMGCILLGVATICLALIELPRTTATHWIMWGGGLLVLGFLWLRLLLVALRTPATLVILDLQDGDERIIQSQAEVAEELCDAINQARAEVRERQ